MMLIFGDRRTKLPGIVTLFFFVSLLDIAGLGLVAPFVSVVLNQANDGSGNGRIYQVFLFIFGEQNRQSLVILLGASLAAIFLFKAMAVTFVNKVIFELTCIGKSALQKLTIIGILLAEEISW